jgi:hypothetical protein
MATSFPAITKEVADIVAALSDPPLFMEWDVERAIVWSERTFRAMERLAGKGLNIDVFDLNFADICQFSERDLLRIRGFGRKSLGELKAKLSDHGWTLASRSHSKEQLNSRFHGGWWVWDDSPQDRLRASEAHKEWLERCAAEAAQPKFSIPTDPEAYAEWRRTGNGLIPDPPAGNI